MHLSLGTVKTLLHSGTIYLRRPHRRGGGGWGGGGGGVGGAES